MSIEGELVRLRPLTPEDVDRYLLWLNDLDVTRTLTVRYPLGRETEREIVERLANTAGYEDVNFAIEVRETGEHLGSVGVGGTYRESRWGTLGIFIGAKDHWGHGYGYDALREMLRFAFWEMNLLAVRLEVFATNERARDLYERVGFVLEGRKRGAVLRLGESVDVDVMSITRAEFEARHGTPPDLRLLEVLP
ncbi:MAG: GNAT family protein [Chloroflexi bacterium]|nr:GNAT family protein [Chloroflexota bacterium]MDA1239510.1 GNAT family protein [Chloroflexota bacterium]